MLLSQFDPVARLAWLDAHRAELEQQVSWVGTPIFSYALGNAKDYRQIVVDVAAQLGASAPAGAHVAEIEAKLLEKLWSDVLSRLTEKEREELLAKVEAVASNYGPSAKKEMAGFVGLAAAQMSGFGVYLLGSTLLGAVNSALGLGLGFGAFTGLSSLISVAIGPIGWAAMGLFAIRKLGAANYKKLLPVVILIAVERAGGALLPPTQALLGAPTRSGPTASAAILSPNAASLITAEVEKDIFDLKPENRELLGVVRTVCPESHFLDLSPDLQQVVRDLLSEKLKSDKETEQPTVEAKQAISKEKRKRNGGDQGEARLAGKQASRTEGDIIKLRRHYAGLLRNLEFDDAAIERLSFLQESQIGPVRDKLGILNLGEFVYRDAIANTDPKIYEVKAGYEYRIYFCPNGKKYRIRLIGDKGTQESDLRLLRK
jgi:uncharacterized protein YaaW (UPF0174 family)